MYLTFRISLDEAGRWHLLADCKEDHVQIQAMLPGSFGEWIGPSRNHLNRQLLTDLFGAAGRPARRKLMQWLRKRAETPPPRLFKAA